MLGDMDRDGLATALVAARDRLQPADVGLPAGSRRRVPGLRREEVAALAGISVDYLVRLEQGRGPRPSAQVVTALSRALRLSRDQRDHLHHLAGIDPPRPGRIDDVVRPGTLRVLDRLADLPAMVLDAKGDVLAWNDLALALVGDLTAWPGARPNIARIQFLGGPGRVVHTDEGAALAATVADLRAVSARYPDDPDLAALLTDLRRGSDRFADLWDAGHVEVLREATKTFEHPVVGRLTLDCDVLALPDADQRVIVYSAAPGTRDAEALDLLRVVGVQDLEGTR